MQTHSRLERASKEFKYASQIFDVLYNKETNSWIREYPLAQEYKMLQRCDTLLNKPHYLLCCGLKEYNYDPEIRSMMFADLMVVTNHKHTVQSRMQYILKTFSVWQQLCFRFGLLNTVNKWVVQPLKLRAK
jgi:hypothetical protein